MTREDQSDNADEPMMPAETLRERLAADRRLWKLAYAVGLARADRLRSFATECVEHGDMTPAAARMLNRILDDESTTR